MQNVCQLLLLPGVALALVGCPGPTSPTDTGGGGTDTGTMNDAGIGEDTGVGVDVGTGEDVPSITPDGGTDPDGGTGMDAPVMAPDGGVVATWTDCREAVVFGSDGEPCSFTGSCVECTLLVSPRQALCMAGRLRTAAAGGGACASGTDAGMFTFPDTGSMGGVDGGGTCPPLVVPDPMGGACQEATAECIREGGSPGECITADAACLACVQQEIASCATTNGCDGEAGEAQCCFTENCPDGSCSGTTCSDEWDAYVACVEDAPCAISDLCFPSAPACPPADWPAPGTPGCTSATLACAMAATTSAQFQACLDADTASTPAGESCNGCINDELLSCATMTAGCDDELGLVQCCLNAECPGGEESCVTAAFAPGGACEDDRDDFAACANEAIADEVCGVSPDVCFP